MRKLWLALLLCLGLAPAQAQQATPPTSPGTVVCAYQSTLPIVTANNFAYVQCDSHGNMIITGNTNIPTYSSAAIGLANIVAGDLYCVTGSATKTVKIKGIRVSGTATTAIIVDVSITLRSTLDTGGGLASVPLVKMDQNNPAGTAVVNSFTSAPTPGTAIGPVRARKIAMATQGNAATTTEGLFQFSVYYDQPITLRGATQAACVTTTAGGAGTTWDIDHEHTEE